MRYLLISAAMLLSLTGNSLSQGNPQSDGGTCGAPQHLLGAELLHGHRCIERV